MHHGNGEDEITCRHTRSWLEPDAHRPEECESAEYAAPKVCLAVSKSFVSKHQNNRKEMQRALLGYAGGSSVLQAMNLIHT